MTNFGPARRLPKPYVVRHINATGIHEVGTYATLFAAHDAAQAVRDACPASTVRIWDVIRHAVIREWAPVTNTR